MLGGALVAAASLFVGASKEERSGHRRDPWEWTETLTVASAAVAAATFIAGGVLGWAGLVPAQHAALPPVPLAAVAAVLLAVTPAFFTHRPRQEAIG